MSDCKENDLPAIREFDGLDWFFTKTYRRNLPHWELKGSTYFITTRVVGELGSPFLNPELAQLVIEALFRYHEKKYLLHAYVVMPDHLHLIIKPLDDVTLAQIYKEFKGSTAFYINKRLNRRGQFWQAENFDHLIRDGMGLRLKWEYIKENPVKANLVAKAEDYPFSNFYNPS